MSALPGKTDYRQGPVQGAGVEVEVEVEVAVFESDDFPR
jgi:hypothetical protein